MRPLLRTRFLLTFALLLALALPASAQTTLIFSEYAEGSSSNKAVEIYNPTSAAVDLSSYSLELYSNGNAAPNATMSLSGTVAAGGVHVVAHPSAAQALLDVADQTNGAVINFNGNDAVVLRNSGGIVDVIGQIGDEPATQWGSGLTSTADNTIRRKAEICSGDTDGSDAFDPAAEWDGFVINTFEDFGSHTATCGRTLFFSEYVEGTSNNKALEIYNPTFSSIDLAAEGYNVQLHFNGNPTAGLTINLTGSVAPGDVYVLAQSNAAQTILDEADQTNGAGWFTGNDAVVLRKGPDVLDVIGQIGFDPGTEWGSGLVSMNDNTLRRLPQFCAGDTDGSDAFDPAAEWEGFATNTYDGLGSHTATCTGGGPSNAAPVFTAALTSQSIEAGAAFSFDYDATDGDSDPITFSLVEGPSGSTLDPTSGLFEWTPGAGDAGMSFPVRVGASDGTATTETSATLTVTTPGTAPVFTASFGGTIVPIGTTITFDYDAEDPDGGAVTYSLVSGPAGATLDPSTGLFEWTVSAPGAYEIAVRATDDETSATTTTAYVGATGTLFPGQSGAALRASLRSAFTPDQTMGYDTARDTMYQKIDRGASPDGDEDDVCGVYSGFCVSLPLNVDPSSYLASNGINAEHTWPQSMGADDEPQRSDMHHLYPTKDNVNSSRGNRPYGESPDSDTQRWFKGTMSQTTMPGVDIDDWSESGVGIFEPREVHKGNAARSMLYFYAIYEGAADEAFLEEQVETLAAWNSLDTADVAEVRRTYLIALRQGNVNPLLFDKTLAQRAFADYLPSSVDCQDPATAPSYAGGYVLNQAGSRAFVRVVVPAGGVEFAFYNTNNLVVQAPEADVESGAVLSGVMRTGGTFAFSPASPTEVYFPITTAGGGTGVSFFLKITDTCGRTVDVDPAFEVTGVEAADALAFSLEQSAPNPVRERSEIRFSLERAGEATLVLYDVLGREVAVLVSGTMEAGAHAATVDADALPSGVYVYRLVSNGRTITRTLTVAR